MNLEDVHILVVGDIMLDKYVVGEVNRISPEAPVPVVNVTDKYSTLGGCGNVVRNIRELGAQVDCVASIGVDDAGVEIRRKFQDMNIGDGLFFEGMTTVKERIVSEYRHIQMLRVDTEYTSGIPSGRTIRSLFNFENNIYDMIIISDYAKGMINETVLDYIKKQFHAPIIIDPKPSNASIYNDVYLITPNEKEWNQMINSNAELDLIDNVLITKGKDGSQLIENYRQSSHMTWTIPAEPVEIFNVSGAGDTVVAIMTVCLSTGWNMLDSAYIANKCAGYVVSKPDTTAVPKHIFDKNASLFIRKQGYPPLVQVSF